ncbi:DegT/DnrJ/EryC1/StrS family aminotransferase [Demequina sediminicola]|uniref:DegT/DnrJ/EryC1/StrS family aminotransferase n=1 Tax=Demequina sediminicola TaxID=1095026 RepID=UPI00078035BE|nr:DegT/DnrJ/EryC1/StrS family aminotransferase [Demequina sediminicola]
MDTVRQELARLTGTRPDDWHLTFKARYGLQQVYRALAAEQKNGTVLTQSLTCSTAVDPILVEGLRPVYADIHADSCALDPDALTLPDDAVALTVQHTFGIVDEPRSRALAAAARGRNVVVVEDSAHALGRMARDEHGVPLADVSVHSFGVEKALPTKFGGAVWINPDTPHTEFRDRASALLEALVAPSARLQFAAKTYRTQLGVLRRLPGALSRPMRAGLTRAGLFEPAVAPSEQAGELAHSDLAASDWVQGHMAEHLPQLGTLEQSRRASVAVYLETLSDLVPAGVAIVDADGALQPLIRLPLLVPAGVDADAVVADLRGRGVYAGSWYRPALFPGATDPSSYGYDPSDPAVAVTEDVISRIVNVPTGRDAHETAAIAAHVREAIDSFQRDRT